MTEFWRFFELTYYIGGFLLLLWLAVGIVLGVAQILMGRSVNLWPLQISVPLVSISLALVFAAFILGEAYTQIATISSALSRSKLLIQSYRDALGIIEVSMFGITLQIFAVGIGRLIYVNTPKSKPLEIPAKGAAVDELRRQEQGHQAA